MRDAIETKQVGEYTVSVVSDDMCESPRKWDHFSVMVCFHKRYVLGDKTDLRKEDFSSWDELEKHLREECGAVVVLPLYLYDHSGLRMSVGKFSCPWDSGQVGFIYVTGEAVEKEGWPIAERLERATACLTGEVEVYDQYLRGDVYGYVVEKDGKHIDSCYGFYGLEHAIQEGVDMAEWHIKKDRERKQSKLKAFVKNKVPLERRQYAKA